MITLKNLKFTYANQENPTVIIDRLHVKKGDCVILCGRSGSGKTTLTRLLNGLIPEYYPGNLEGHIKISHLVPGENDLEEFSQSVASVFQNPATQFFHRKVEHELVFPCENQGISADHIWQRLNATVDFFNIADLLHQDLLTTSGGQRQKIALATANMQAPKLLVLDEPSANLDQGAVNQLQENLQQLKSLGITIVIAEHRLDYLQNLGDSYLYFEDGKLKAEWSQKDWLHFDDNYRHELGLRAIHQEKSIFPFENEDKNALEIKNLQVKTGKKLLGNIKTFKFPKGSVTAIIGPNGIGKSSFAKILSGLENSERQIKYEDSTFSEKERLSRTAYVMQNVHLQLFSNSVKGELLLGNQNNSDYLEIAKSFHLDHLLDRHPMSLSGGEKQRLLISNALLSNKDIFIFDEPTSGLDHKNMLIVSRYLKILKKYGKIVILITHDNEIISQACDRVLDLSKAFNEKSE